MKIIYSTLKILKSLSIVIIMIMIANSISAYGQGINSSDQEIKIASHSASEAYNYALQAHTSDMLTDVKSYMQIVLSASAETKTATMNAERLLIEKEKQANNSGNAEIIENLKDQREEMTKAIEEAKIAYDYALRASKANDLETLHECAWEISKASKKVLRQTEAAQRYSSYIDTNK